ncbi:penicillin-binding protein 1A [Bermanella sp. R86510]|uniref:penicillin-binding protein 1A n=1 Tax=unclassified Bermanella TaxID=2627862 RepID=UPI0037C8A913
MMKKNRPVLRFLILAPLAGLFSLILGTASVYLYLASSLPSVESLKDVQLQTPLRIYTADQKLIAEFGEKRRTPVAYDSVPMQFYNALIAAEDENFYTHPGIDIKGLLRAAFELITTGEKRSGGSTITMQVAKNYYLSSEKTFTRKFTEILLAMHIEQEISKKEILELYVNKIYLGKRAYGVEAAARVYYGKGIAELSLAQLAMIAGLPQAPSAANPINNPERAMQRRNYVLARMFTEGFISQEAFTASASEPISAKYHGLASEVNAPYVAEMVRSEMAQRFPDDLYTKGYRVTTSLQSTLQQAAQKALRQGLHKYDRDHGLRVEADILPPYILQEQQSIEVSVAPEIWQPGNTLATVDKKIPLPPSPETLNHYHWLEQISDRPTPGDLTWAVVTSIDDETGMVRAFTAQEKVITLEKEHYEWARPHVNVNIIGNPIKQPSEIFSVGQAILLEPQGDHFMFAQTPEVQGSLVSMDPQDGGLLALVGGYDFSLSKYNRAIQASRQPGSSFKPFVYSAGLEFGFTPASIFNDAPIVFEDDGLEAAWRPENYSGKFYGPTRLRHALYKSRNLVSIRLLNRTGIGRTVRYISGLGLPQEKLNRDLSLALGSSDLTPFELATGFTVLANGGYRVDPYFIKRIEDNEGNVLLEHEARQVCESCLNEIETYKTQLAEQKSELNLQTLDGTLDLPNTLNEGEGSDELTLEEFIEQYPPLAPRVMDSRVNYLMYTMLQDVVKRGTGKRALALGREDLAGKTGTTNDNKDAWFSGFNNKISTNVWVGFDDFTTLGRWAFGSNTALPIWVDYMRTALNGMPHSPIKRPDGLVTVRIDPESGKRAYPGQPDAIFETFRQENVPQEMESAPSFPAPNTNNSSNAGNDAEDEEENVTPEQLF